MGSTFSILSESRLFYMESCCGWGQNVFEHSTLVPLIVTRTYKMCHLFNAPMKSNRTGGTGHIQLLVLAV